MIRAFIALELDDAVRQYLRDRIRELKGLGLHARFSRPENLHLTLKFLGNIEPAAVEPTADALQQAGQGIPAIDLTVSGRGAFPNAGRPRIVWSGVRSEGGLGRLYRRVEDLLADLGYETESRPFRPHLTLARLRSPRKSGRLRTWLEAGKEDAGVGWQASEVVLFQSELHPDGARHTPLRRVPLEESD